MTMMATRAALALGMVLSVANAHLSRLPGRFSNPHLAASSKNTSSCSTKFQLNGTSFDTSALQVDVGGYIADNSVDKFSYCINLCAPVTSERNCICYPCGGSEYPATQIFKDPSKGETCEAYLGQANDATWAFAKGKEGLTLSYDMGQDGKSTVITLLCDPSVTGEDTGPSFVGSKNGVFAFEWRTKYSCMPK